jgi:phosphoribosylformylglycinamidine cyclo-ligase
LTAPEPPAIFGLLAREGPVELAEMRRTLNMGVGMVLVVDGAAASDAVNALASVGEVATPLGTVVATPAGDAPYVEYV